LFAISLSLICLTSPALSQSGDVRTGTAAFVDWQSDAPGVRRHIRPSDLPTPTTGTDAEAPDFRSVPRVVQPSSGTQAWVPADFSVQVLARGLNQPRVMRLAPNGDIFVAESGSGRVLVFPANATAPAQPQVFAEGLERPYGIVFHPRRRFGDQ
jgi:glucose/arabinose dehydrogenase